MLEEITNWEHPPWYGITQFEEKSRKIFEENQTGLHHKTQRQVMVQQQMISGQFQGTTFTVIPLNWDSNITCREKSHAQFHYDLLPWPELQLRPWMWCLNAALTIIGMSKGTEICQMRGRVSHSSPYWMKTLQTDIHGPGSGWQRSNQHPGQITCGQKCGQICQTQRNAKNY